MRKFFYLLVIFVVAAAGFYFGRLSGIKDAPIPPPVVNRDRPLPPPPPESEPFIPGMHTEEDQIESKALLVESPLADAQITGAFEVAGRVQSDAEKMTVSLLDAEGNELFSRKIDVVPTDDESHVRFEVAVGDLGYVGPATLRIVYSGADGGEETREIMMVSDELVDVEIFFTNPFLNPWSACDKVFSVRRQVSKNGSIYRAALEELFRGPNETETENGYGTELPEGVKLKSVASDADGVLTADFSRQLDQRVAGSCRVTAIQSQIAQTLKQFPEVRDVVISIEGETEGILQP